MEAWFTKTATEPEAATVPIRLITVLVEFCPGDLVALRVEHGAMRRALFARGELAWLLAPSQLDEVYL